MGFFIGIGVALIFSACVLSVSRDLDEFKRDALVIIIIGVVLLLSIFFGFLFSLSGAMDERAAEKAVKMEKMKRPVEKDTIKWEESEWAQ